MKPKTEADIKEKSVSKGTEAIQSVSTGKVFVS